MLRHWVNRLTATKFGDPLAAAEVVDAVTVLVTFDVVAVVDNVGSKLDDIFFLRRIRNSDTFHLFQGAEDLCQRTQYLQQQICLKTDMQVHTQAHTHTGTCPPILPPPPPHLLPCNMLTPASPQHISLSLSLSLSLSVQVCMYVCMYVCMHVYTYVWIHVCMNACMYDVYKKNKTFMFKSN